jgi:Tfp pilus assembly PilM family ATPase
MSESSTGTIATSATACGKCKTDNVLDAQFCAGCGHHLFEPCPGCGKSVRLVQKYCGGCGSNLKQNLEQRAADYQQRLVDAVEAAKTHRYDEAIDLLAPMVSKMDYRLERYQQQAIAAKSKIEALKSNGQANFEERWIKVKDAVAQKNHHAIVKLLSDLPAPLLSDEAKSCLASSKEFIQEVEGVEAEAQRAIDGKDWIWAGGSLGRLLTLIPEHPVYTKLAGDVSKKIAESAEKMFANGRFSKALDYLHALPSVCQSEQTDKLIVQAEDLVWLGDQFARQPFVTDSLQALAGRLLKDAPQDPTTAVRIKELEAKKKEGKCDPRSHLARYEGSGASVLGGFFDYLSQPQAFDWSEVSEVQSHRGLCGVALGAAVSGLGLGRQIPPLWSAGGGLLSGLRRRKANVCWGIDIGASGIQAVRVEKDSADKLIVRQAEQVTFEVPLSRGKTQNSQSEIIRKGIADLLTKIEVNDEPIWVSFRASETIHHFLRLPPVAKKQANKLLEVERRERIPLAIDDVSTSTWMADVDGLLTSGIPATLIAVRKNTISDFVELLKTSGLNPSAVVPESVALVRFIDVEFASELDPGEAPAEKYPAIAFLDSGADTTKLILVSQLEYWFGHFDAGGENITSEVTRTEKVTRSAAESLKRDVAKLPHPSATWGPIDEAYQTWRSQLKLLQRQAAKYSANFEIQSTWCVGGTPLTHDFFRQVIQADEQ